ncbi:MAG: hypothetical protein ACT6TH_14475 [Brevundimonas sp.]|uniref:hypothetical protein n=1 Tax=Brevundimonas sp. TaxID=1871086 RepID=UPI0040331922
MTVVSLSAQKWLGLCDHADQAATLLRPVVADDLANAAGRLTTTTPPYKGAGEFALFMSFRWDCTAFGHADPLLRATLAEGLIVKSRLVRALLTPGTPDAGAVAMPVPSIEEPRWAQRADIGG